MLVCFFDSLIYNVGGRRSLLFFGFGCTGFLLHSPQCRPSETQLIGNGVVVVLEQPLHLRNALHNGLRGAAGGVLQGRVFLPQLFQKLVLANGLDEELPLDAGGGVHGLPVEVDIPLDHRRKGDEVGGPGIEPEQLVQFFPELFLPAQRDRARLPPHRKDPEQLDHIIAPLPERRKGKGKDREHLPQLPGEAARLFRLQQGDDAGLEHLEGCAAHAEERVVDQHLSQAGEERLGRAARTGTPMGDVLGALNMTVGVLAALVNKQRTGKGEKVDVALVDSVAAAMENITMIYQSTGRIPQRIGNRYESTYPYDTFPAKDGDVVIAAGNNKLYAILCDVMGKPELKTDPRFAEVKDRVANHVAMREIIVPWTKQHTIDEVDKLLNDAGCPACPVNTLDRLVVDPQIAGARGMFPTIDQPGIGELQITAIPAHTTRTSTAPRKAAPLLGEDNADVYGKLLGLDEAKLADLKAKGVI